MVAVEKGYQKGVDLQVEIEPLMCHVHPVFANIFPQALYYVLEHLNLLINVRIDI